MSLLPEGIGPTSVVRERPLPNGSGSGDPDLLSYGIVSACMARDRPSPYGAGVAFFS